MMQRLASIVAPLLALMVLMVLTLAVPAGAQQQPGKSPLGVSPPAASDRGLTAGRPPAAAPAPIAEPAGPFTLAWMWIEQQRTYFNRLMSAAVRNLRTEPFGAALLSLIAICFTYGVLHAAGPGHGKGVISAYALANNETIKRGILLSFMSALFQAFSAIAIFLVLSLIFAARKTDFDRVEGWLETASWALIAAIGAWLLVSRVRALWGGRPAHAHHHHGPATHAHHDHAHSHGHAAHHHDHHDHQHDEHCGHMHMPAPRQLQGAWSWRKAFGIAASVGIRPCTGALILLAFCSASGLLWAGIVGTLAMSLGTAIAISVLATLAVGSRQAAQWFAGGDSRWGQHVGTAAGIVGSALILAMGCTLFIMSLKGPGPL